MFSLINKFALIILSVIGLIELGLAVWSVVNDRYKVLAYNLSDVGYIVSKIKHKKIFVCRRYFDLIIRIYGYYGIYRCVTWLQQLLY